MFDLKRLFYASHLTDYVIQLNRHVCNLEITHRDAILQSARQWLLQSTTVIFITMCGSLLLQSSEAILLHSATILSQSATALLQSETGVTKCDSIHMFVFTDRKDVSFII